MTKVRKVKRRKKFRVNVNRKRLRNKLRKLPAIGCEEIKDAWEVKKSTRSNLGEMGLAYNPNEILKIPNTKRELINSVKDKFRDTEHDEDDEEEMKKGPPAKIHVAEKLESEAKAPRVCLFKLPKNEVQFATYMMDKYGDNYKAMVRDRKNYYQLTWRQIRSKINRFKGIPEQYAEYLLKRGEIVLDDPEPLEETRRKIALENIQKHCIPKKPKQKTKEPVWEVESINGDDTDHNIEEEPEETPCENNEATKNVIADGTQNDSQKKLKLFSDNESDDESESGLNNTKLNSGGIIDKSITQKRQAKDSFHTDKVENKKSKNNKRMEILKKMCSSDSDTEEEFEGDDDETGFVDLSDMSEEGLSDDDILDDGEFVTDSNEESD